MPAEGMQVQAPDKGAAEEKVDEPKRKANTCGGERLGELRSYTSLCRAIWKTLYRVEGSAETNQDN